MPHRNAEPEADQSYRRDAGQCLAQGDPADRA
jgi:hypothetical protein